MIYKLHLRSFLFSIGVLFVVSICILWITLPSEIRLENCNRHFLAERHSQALWSCTQKENRLAIIIPFRERTNELLQLVPHLRAFLNRQRICHQFYVINQKDKYRFNRGMLINVGFVLAHNESDYIAMHDVDLLPINNQLSYAFPVDGPFHLTAPNLHPKYHYDKYVGGILLLQNRHFIQVNGFSNRYWGWGLEDDEFYTRLKEANLKIYRPQNVTSNSSNSFLHLHDQTEHKRDMAKLFNQREVTRKRDRQTGLNTARFELLKVHHLTVDGVPFRLFDVSLHCDRESTPWCQRVSSSAVRNHATNQRAAATATH